LSTKTVLLTRAARLKS